MKGAFGYEIKKIFGSKIVISLLALLIVFNIVIGFFIVPENDFTTQEMFDKSTESVIYSADTYYSSIADKSSQMAVYQLRLIEHFKNIRDIRVSGNIKGFDLLLTSFYPYLSALIFAVWAAIQLAVSEYSSMNVLLTFKEKRRDIGIWKIAVLVCASFLSCILFCLCFSVSSFFRGGFSGGFAPIQSILAYIHCPYKINIVTALFLRIFFAGLFIILAAIIIYTFTLLVKSFIPSLLAVVAVAGLDFIAVLKNKDVFSFFYNFNFQTFIKDTWLVRYSGIKLGVFLSKPVLSLIIAAILLVLFSFLSVFVLKKATCIKNVKNKKVLSKERKKRSHGIAFYELKKMFTAKAILIFIIVFVFKFVFLYVRVKAPDDIYDNIYKTYIETMNEMSYTEQSEYIKKEIAREEEIIVKTAQLRALFEKDESVYEEFFEYIQLEGVAKIKISVLNSLKTQVATVYELQKKGLDAGLIYTTGLNSLFALKPDFFCVIAIVLLVIPYLAIDDESGFSKISSGFFIGRKKSKRRFDMRKNVLMLVFSVFTTVLFMTTDILFINFKIGLPALNEYAVGLRLFSGIEMFRIWHIFAIRLLISVFGTLMIIGACKIAKLFLENSIFIILAFIFTEFVCIVLSSMANIFAALDFTSYFGYGIFLFPLHIVLLQSLIIFIAGILIYYFVCFRNIRKRRANIEIQNAI
ncbi:MAG: hypothetical protein ACI4QR_00810 [Eubacteriales bacterium]